MKWKVDINEGPIPEEQAIPLRQTFRDTRRAAFILTGLMGVQIGAFVFGKLHAAALQSAAADICWLTSIFLFFILAYEQWRVSSGLKKTLARKAFIVQDMTNGTEGFFILHSPGRFRKSWKAVHWWKSGLNFANRLAPASGNGATKEEALEDVWRKLGLDRE